MKLWDKGTKLNKAVEKFTVGNDFQLDQKLVEYDLTASIAHAMMLEKIGVLTKNEERKLVSELNKIKKLNKKGKFLIKQSDEDMHTAIENQLAKKLGELGKKIHMGRSRNDQVLVALRLYSKEKLLTVKKLVLQLCLELVEFSEKHSITPMPGFTHLQKAMPSSVGLWSASFAEALMDELKLMDTVSELNNQNPLGSAAGYGVPLDLDRKFTTKLLGFKKTQNNCLFVQNSRGMTEAKILFVLSQIMSYLAKFANDLILFSCSEFNYFSLPEEFCTGSSIMPQKKNPDVLELIRAKSSEMKAYLFQVTSLVEGLPSGYNRDLQLTKGPLINSFELAEQTLKICLSLVPKIKPNKEVLEKACTSELYATDYALKLAEKGMPFRNAYKEIGKNLDKLDAIDPVKAIKKRKHLGAPGNLGLKKLKKKIAKELSLLK